MQNLNQSNLNQTFQISQEKTQEQETPVAETLVTEAQATESKAAETQVTEAQAAETQATKSPLQILGETVRRQSLHREILYKTLVFCKEQKNLATIEDFIASLPEFKQATLSQYHLIAALVKGGGLNKMLLNEAGDVLCDKDFEGLSEDEIDDLIYDEAYITTEVGNEFVEKHQPKLRIHELFEDEGDRTQSYVELLSMCANRSYTYKELDAYLKDKGVLFRMKDGERQAIQSSVFLDKLQRAGALFYDGGWMTTKEGKEYLKALQSA